MTQVLIWSETIRLNGQSTAADCTPCRCLILVTRPQQVSEGLALCRAMAADTRFEPVMAAPVRYQRLLRDVDATRIVELDGSVVAMPAETTAPPATSAKKPALSRKIVRWGGIRFLVTLWRIRRARARSRALIDAVSPQIAVVFEDRIILPELVFLKTLRRSRPNCRVFLVSTAISLRDGRLAFRRGKAEYILRAGWLGPLKAFLARRYPKQVYANGGDPVTFYADWEFLAVASSGLAEGNPWVLGDRADLSTCFGPDDFHRMVAEGARPERMFVAGQASLDSMFVPKAARAEKRRDLCSRYGFNAARPVMICAVPQYLEEGLVSSEQHLELTEALFEAFSGHQVLLSLHPKSSPKDYASIAQKHGLTVLSESLSEVLPACDLLIATYSSTIRWALMMGTPALVVDAIKRRYTIFDGLQGVRVTFSAQEAGVVLDLFENDLRQRAVWQQAALADGTKIGLFDGQASARILDRLHAESRRARFPDNLIESSIAAGPE